MNENAKRIWEFQIGLTLKRRNEYMSFNIKDISNEFESLRELIYKVLEQYPEARDSNLELYVHCVKKLGANSIDDLLTLNISPLSVGRLAQMIQNNEGKFQPSERVRNARQVRKQQATVYFGEEQ